MVNKKNKSVLIILLALLVAAIVGVGYFIYHKDNSPVVMVNQTAHTTSKLPTAQSGYSSGKPRSTSSSNNAQGGATDNNGAVTNPGTPTGQPTSSTSGLITLQYPSANQIISSGVQIYGQAQVSTVQFQLVDNASGLLAQGSLNVVNGKFSGTLQFTPSSNNGQLNIFSQNSPTSPEVNIISIPVGLN